MTTTYRRPPRKSAAQPASVNIRAQALVSAGLQPIKGAQLYPALVRLEDQGLLRPPAPPFGQIRPEVTTR